MTATELTALYEHVEHVWREKRDKGETDLSLLEWAQQALELCFDDDGKKEEV